jgi:hypothetical protein
MQVSASLPPFSCHGTDLVEMEEVSSQPFLSQINGDKLSSDAAVARA